MSEEIRKRLDFPNTLIQSQAVGHLIAAVLKENVLSNKISQSSNQTPALKLLWEKSCSDNMMVRTTCCEALVMLVKQDHAEFGYILNTALSLIPSARNVQGLIKIIVKLLQMQALKTSKNEEQQQLDLYAIRNSPHPLIIVLENRPDCWPFLLQHMTTFFQQCPKGAEHVWVNIMRPFLRYLYCEPYQLREHAELRMSLLRVLLQPYGPLNKEEPHALESHLLQLLCDLVPYYQVKDALQITEALLFLEGLFRSLLRHPSFWRTQLCHLCLQLLVFCEVSLQATGECSSLIGLMEENVELLKEGFPFQMTIIGLGVLLLQIPASQQKPILNLAIKLLSGSEIKMTPLMAVILVMPALQILSSTAVQDNMTEENDSTARQQLAINLLEIVQQEELKEQHLVSWDHFFPINSIYGSLHVTWQLLWLLRDKTSMSDWLSSVKSMLPIATQVSVHVVLLVAYLLIQENEDNLHSVLDATIEIAKVDSSQVPNLIPVLMFKLGRPLEATLCRDILYALPALGVHKVCVAQILRVLQVLGNTPKLQAVTLRLMTCLWEKQDRVYPELQRFMAMSDMASLSVSKDTQWEKVIAKAASIRDICKQRPYQHGADMLAAISQVLNECTKADQATPAALVLQGLHALCQAEVVCIRSTWDALSPKLSCDTRPLILKTLNELFSLVPSLMVNSSEYEKFKAQVVSFLWSHTQNKDSLVAISAYKSLSEFHSEEYTILHLPEQARPELDQQKMDLEEEEGEEEEEPDLSVPGHSYIKLLLLTPLPVLQAFAEFAASLVKEEMANMPRGIYHSALRGNAVRSDHGKTLSSVPNFMLKMHERNKQPGLKPGLAAGMLLSYDLPIHVGKDGKPINRFLASRGRNFHQMFIALIHEVNIQPSEWHHSLLLPHSWAGFMERTYHAILQGRQAELEMQLKHGKEEPEQVQYKQFTAWLWVRDMLTDAVKGSSKESPVVKGNCLLALTGLAVAVAKHEKELTSDIEEQFDTEPDFLPTKHWLSMVIDTLLSIVDSHYCPKGRIFPWFYQKSYSGENTASAIARSCAATSLSLLVPVFIVSYKERVEEVLNLLIAMLPGKPNADESQAVQIHMSLALGMFISRLCEEKVSDVADKQMNLLLWKSLAALEDCCFDTSLEYNTGCILGVGLVLSLMSHSNLTDSEGHISTSLRKLCKYLDDAEDQSRTLQEILAYTIACVCVSAFSTRIVEATEAEEVMDKLQKLTEMNQQTPGFALALGSLVHGLSVCGHGKADVLSNKLFPVWMKTVLAEGAPTMQRLAAVNGLVSLMGSESTMIQLKSEAIQSSQFQSKLNEVIRTLTQTISFSGVIGLQVNAAWMLGHLYLSNMSATRSRTSVPSDFSYLPEKSFLRAAIDFIIEGGKKGPEQVHPSVLKAAMAPIALIGGSYQYPPLNWASILAPLLRLDFGEEIQQLCIELAVTQAQSSQNAAMILGMWVAPPLVYSLSIQAKRYLFTSLPLWMKYVAEDKQQIFTEVFMVQHFEAKKQSKNQDLCWNILQGLNQAMKSPSPTQHSWSCFCKAAEKIFELLPDEIWQDDVKMYILAAKCLSEMVDTEIERITEVSKNNLEKVAFVRVYLVSQGRFPLLRWNDVISAAAGCQQKETIVWMLLHSFYHARILSHENTGVLKRMEWLLEFMGYIKKVSLNTASMQNVSPQEAVSFLLWIFAACVVAWADHAMPMLLGLSADWSAWQRETIDGAFARALGKRPVDTLAVKEILNLLPGSLQILLTKEPWKEQTPKFIDWLFSLMENPNEMLSQSSRYLLKASLLSLRSLPEFKKKAVWTKAYGW
ncbi:focadhesin isoform X1 [Crotalus tigris]|uniref:focadhesin isoform X1 n=2 Tax=Crotalus tigris TaxID=88082 RepID=UPI00192F395D|nr:focadhesin isoform X1 [Crotalus tigris]XP_039212994.1 focadhesin isoform X1 [Crotalus tigris]XP_039212995.1 focadhesin isoform X1 [Crotalus tigris]